METAVSLGKLLAATTGGQLTLVASQMFSTLFEFAWRHGAYSLRDRSAFFGLSKGSLSAWMNKSTVPSLQRVFEMCELNGLQINDVAADRLHQVHTHEDQRYIESRWMHRSLTGGQKRRIPALLARISMRTPPPTLAQAAREIGVAVKTLKRLAPATAKRITTAAAQAKRENAEHNFTQFRKAVRDLVSAGITKGILPSRMQLEHQLTKPGWFRDAKRREFVRQELARARRSLVVGTFVGHTIQHSPPALNLQTR